MTIFKSKSYLCCLDSFKKTAEVAFLTFEGDKALPLRGEIHIYVYI